MGSAAALDLAIGATAGVLAYYDLERCCEVLRNLQTSHTVFAGVLIVEIRGFNSHMLPLRRKSRTDDALAVEGLGDDAEEALDERATADADAIAKVAIALATGGIVMADLAEVGGALAVVHLVEDVGLEEAVACLGTTCLEISQGGVHDLGSRHIVDAPGIGHPIAGGDGVIARLLDRDMGDVAVDVLRGAISLLGGAGATVDGGVDAPHGGMWVQATMAHGFLIFCPYALFRHPQPPVHGLQDGRCLGTIGPGVLADELSDAGRQLVATIVIGRAVGDGTTAIIEGIARPDTAIGVVEMVAIGIEVAFLPGEMAGEHGPHTAHISGIGIVLEMP